MEWARFRWIIRRTVILSNLKPNLPKNLEEISSTIPHPEGITLDDKDNIFVSSASTGNIFLVSKNDIKVHANTKGRPLGIAYSKKLNSLIAADAARKSVLRISLGNASISVLCREYEDMDLNGPSDLIITENEEIIFTDPIRNPFPNPCISPVYKIPKSNKIETFLTDLAFPSGIANIDSKIYISETRANRLVVMEDNQSDEIIEPQMFRRFADPGYPDGITVDDDKNIYQTLPGIGAIAVINSDGEMTEIYHMESWKPSNIHYHKEKFYVTDRLGSRIFRFSK